MSWLADQAALTGARWSAGATWGTSEWVDPDDVPEYDPDEAIRVGVFVAGIDVTAKTRSASWSVGQSDVLSEGIQVGSAALTLQEYAGGFDSAGFSYEGFEPIDDSISPAIGSRVVVATDWDVLWVGTTEGSTLSEAAGQQPSVSVRAVDDLARANQDVTDEPSGGYLFPALDQLLAKAGISGSSWTRAPGDQSNPYDFVNSIGTSLGDDAYELTNKLYSGSIISLLGAFAYHCCMGAAWTPYGLRVGVLHLQTDTYNGWLSNVWHQVYASDVEHQVDRVYNDWTVSDSINTWTHVDTASVDAYGRRAITVDGSAYRTAKASDLEDQWWTCIYGRDRDMSAQAWPRYSEPFYTRTLRARINSKRHRLTRALPFDNLYVDDFELWRVLSVSHDVSVDGWNVTLDTVRTISNV
jgi:hypothetical protein